MTNFLLILLALMLVLLNAFFVAAEFGMVKIRSTRLEELKKNYGLRGRILTHVHKHLDAYLSICQLGITFASLGLGWIGEPAFAYFLEPIFQVLGIISPQFTSVASFFIAFSFISFLHIVVGELMPKSLAIRQSEKISLWTAVPLYGFYWLMYPAIWVLNSCSNFLLRVFGLDEIHHGEIYSTNEIKLLLNANHLHGELTKEEVDMLEHTLDFADLKVTEVMRYCEEMVLLDIKTPIHQTMNTIIEHRYSRYPVYDSDKKEIIGIIHTKDVLSTLYQKGEIKELIPLLRPVLKVSRRKPAIDLLNKFREGMPHFALIYSGHEQLIGFITLDNLLHVLIGRIKDEFHRTQVDWVVNDEGSVSVRGDCSLYSLEQALGREIDIGDEEIETLAALIFNKTNMPKEGQRISFKEFDAQIEKMDASRIRKVTVYPKQENSSSTN